MASPSGEPSRSDLERWLEQFGAHTASYVLLEGDKRYVSVRGVEGFAAYELRAGFPILAGDPVSAPSDSAALLRAVRQATRPRPVFAYAVRPEMLGAFRDAGFGAVPIGVEPTFDPRRFTLAGGARATLRAAVNHATKDGLTVIEHDPHTPTAVGVNQQLSAISDEWLATKHGGELGFLLGQPLLHQRTKKRYFVASSASRVEGFLVCEPIFARGGWYLDVTRRRDDAVRGTMELLTVRALETFGTEGAGFASMGLAPLGRLEEGDRIASDSPRLRALFGDAFATVTHPYDFRNLLRYKTKYSPDAWEPRFLCYTRGLGERLAVFATWIALRRARRSVVTGDQSLVR